MKPSATLGALLVLTALAPAAAADHTYVITAADAATNYGDAVTLSAQLTFPSSGCPPGGCPVGGAQVDFYVDGAFVGTDVTNSGGFAYLRIEAAQAWHVGAHSIRAQYDRNNDPGSPAVAAATLTIHPEATQVIAHRGYLAAQLLDDDHQPLAGQAVHFHVTTPLGEQDLCTAYTDAAGFARCAATTGAGVAPLGASATEYHATFDGTGDYRGASGSATLL